MSQNIMLTEVNKPEDVVFSNITIGQHFLYEGEIF